MAMYPEFDPTKHVVWHCGVCGEPMPCTTHQPATIIMKFLNCECTAAAPSRIDALLAEAVADVRRNREMRRNKE